MKTKPEWLTNLEHRELQRVTEENMRNVIAKQNCNDAQKQINKLFSN